MRKKEKISQCEPHIDEVIKFANLLPSDYKLNWDAYPESSADQKKWFFELIKTLPPNFFEDLPQSTEIKNALLQVVNKKTFSPDEILESKKEPFFSEVSKTPPHLFKRAWREYFLADGEVKHFYPVDFLTKECIYPAIRCRRVLPQLTLYWTYRGLAQLRRNGMLVLPKELLKGCDLVYNHQTQAVELSSYPIDVIVNNKTDVSRIRICPSCNKWFWAKRTDAETCGEKKCVDKIGGNKYHNQNKKEVNRKKRQKYYEENNIDFCANCIRPLATHEFSNCSSNNGENVNGTV